MIASAAVTITATRTVALSTLTTSLPGAAVSLAAAFAALDDAVRSTALAALTTRTHATAHAVIAFCFALRAALSAAGGSAGRFSLVFGVDAGDGSDGHRNEHAANEIPGV